jgi:hypothetical protein
MKDDQLNQNIVIMRIHTRAVSIMLYCEFEIDLFL